MPLRRRAICAALAIFALAALACSSSGGGSQAARPGQASDLLAAVKQRGTILVSTDANYKPQSFRTKNGSWQGFDVDVAAEIARRLGVKPEFFDSDFNAVTAGNWLGKWDINVDSMAITKARTNVLWFTEPYYFVPASYAVRRGVKLRGLQDLNGKRIGVGAATTYELYLQGKLPEARIPAPPGISIVTYKTDEDGLDDLARSGGTKVDAMLTALPTIRAAIARGLPLRLLEPPVFSDTSAIALDRRGPNDSQPLLWAIDGIIHDMHKDGTLTRLSMKYYRIDLTVRR